MPASLIWTTGTLNIENSLIIIQLTRASQIIPATLFLFEIKFSADSFWWHIFQINLGFLRQRLMTSQFQAPSCVSILHDGVMSTTTLNVLSFLHIVPLIIFIYIFLRNLSHDEVEHLFLYVRDYDSESAQPSTTNTENNASPSHRSRSVCLSEPASFQLLYALPHLR